MDQPAADPVVLALSVMLGRTGATSLRFGYDDDSQPVVWWAVATYAKKGKMGRRLGLSKDRHAYAAGPNLRAALFRLAESIVDGGTCLHCHKPTGITLEHGPMPLPAQLCWYQYDPELRTIRRGCE